MSDTRLPQTLMAPWQQCMMEMRKEAADKIKSVTPARSYPPAGVVCLSSGRVCSQHTVCNTPQGRGGSFILLSSMMA